MGSIIASATMSMDGYLAQADHAVGPLFDWYQAGEEEVAKTGDLPRSASYRRVRRTGGVGRPRPG